MYFATNGSAVTSNDTPTERMRILSGGGLTFNGDTAQANALDDYEEGTWSGVLHYNTDNTNVTHTNGTISANSATYTKIGRLVYITCNFTTHTTANYVYKSISGLPHTPSANAALKIYVRGGVNRYGGNADEDCVFTGQIFANSTSINTNSERTDLTLSLIHI